MGSVTDSPPGPTARNPAPRSNPGTLLPFVEGREQLYSARPGPVRVIAQLPASNRPQQELLLRHYILAEESERCGLETTACAAVPVWN